MNENLSFNFNINKNEENKPLSKRVAVLTHLKFNSQLDRKGAEHYLSNSESGDFIVRKSSEGENYLALTLVLNENSPYQVRNNKGYPIVHFLIDPEQSSDDFITKSENPIQAIEDYIKIMGIEFSEEKKMEYMKITEINGHRTSVSI